MIPTFFLKIYHKIVIMLRIVTRINDFIQYYFTIDTILMKQFSVNVSSSCKYYSFNIIYNFYI